MERKNKMGDRTEPFGTPLVIYSCVEQQPSTELELETGLVKRKLDMTEQCEQ